jgi:K+-transporting ATPase KdpF subunit
MPVASILSEEAKAMADLWLAGMIGVLLLIYLVYALLKPEEF